MTRLLAAAAVLCVVGPAAAQQVHPCDVVHDTAYQEPVGKLLSLKLGFCLNPVDTDGQPLRDPVGFLLVVNGGPDVDLGIVAPLSTGANAAGEWYFEVQSSKLTAGVLELKAYTSSKGTSPRSTPITLTLVTNLVASPDGTRVPDVAYLVDGQLVVWTLGPVGSMGGVIFRAGTQAADGMGFQLVAYHGEVYVLGADHSHWFRWMGTYWAYYGLQPPIASTPKKPGNAVIVERP